MTQRMEIDIAEVLRFFDEAPSDSRRQATAIVAVAGEDLGVGLLAHCWKHRGATVDALPGPCAQGKKKGSILDRWVRVTSDNKTTYYQVEIKNWSAHAIGGRRLKVDGSLEEVAAHKRERWSKEWDGATFRKPMVRKVLTPMKPRAEDWKVRPLACYWDAMHPDGKGEPLFSVPVSDPEAAFPRVWVFSMSAYLRELRASGASHVWLEMPETVTRMRWLNCLFR